VHDYPERWNSLYRHLFGRARLVIATNQWKFDELRKEFQISESKLVMLRNGVDVEAFLTNRSKVECREALGLPSEGGVVVYTGHLYSWKGVDTLAAAMEHLPDIECYFVGGTDADIDRFKDIYRAPNLHFVGHHPHDEMPLWQGAADALILPNTAKEEIAKYYTSPMKLFEYMASGHPIAASRIPSITEIVTEEMAYLVEPDSPSALAEGIRSLLAFPAEAKERGRRARKEVAKYHWDERARSIGDIVFL
jgi:glycosyltransferase involved in cell wall biosynthesis